MTWIFLRNDRETLCSNFSEIQNSCSLPHSLSTRRLFTHVLPKVFQSVFGLGCDQLGSAQLGKIKRDLLHKGPGT